MSLLLPSRALVSCTLCFVGVSSVNQTDRQREGEREKDITNNTWLRVQVQYATNRKTTLQVSSPLLDRKDECLSLWTPRMNFVNGWRHTHPKSPEQIHTSFQIDQPTTDATTHTHTHTQPPLNYLNNFLIFIFSSYLAFVRVYPCKPKHPDTFQSVCIYTFNQRSPLFLTLD